MGCEILNSEVKERINQIESGVVPKGYKKTKLGIIPEEWEVRKLEEVSEINKDNIKDKNKSYYYYDLSCVSEGRVNKPNEKISYEKLPSRAKRLFNKGDILFSTVRPNLKGFYYVDFEPEDSICSTGFAIIKNKETYDNRYIYYHMFTHKIENKINSLTVGSNYPALNVREVYNLQIPVPLLKEQQKIADILSTWDKSIETLEKLIDEKEQQKKGLMQKLLIGKKRIEGFSGEWEEVKLGSLGQFFKGKGIPKHEIKSSGVNCIIYGEIYTTYDFFTKELHSKVDYDVASNSTSIEYGDILFTGSGETQEDIGKCVMYLGNDKAVAGGDIVIMRPKDIIKNKAYSYLLNSETIHKQTYKLGQGHSVVHIYEKHLRELKIPIIPLPEQKAIAEILSTSDKEIELLKELLQNRKEQKKGLMQLLLTGIVRV